jgi:hypothetical protein
MLQTKTSFQCFSFFFFFFSANLYYAIALEFFICRFGDSSAARKPAGGAYGAVCNDEAEVESGAPQAAATF